MPLYDATDPEPAEETEYAALLMRGTAVEGGEVPMYLRAPEDKTEGTSFGAFCRMTNGGTLRFETPEGEVLSSTTWALADGIYQIVYNTTEKTFTSLAITRMALAGNVVIPTWKASGVALTYRGNGVWRDTLDLVPHTGPEPECGRFCMNSWWILSLKARNGVEGVLGFAPDQEDCGYTLEDIPLRHGRKDITLDLRHFTYSIECVDIAENKITFFGSSVCYGLGASLEENIRHGYAWQYMQLLAARHEADNSLSEYEYSNTSISGNNTLKLLARYKGHMYGDCGRYVVIGMGMGNEGLHNADNYQAVYDQWKTNMLKLIELGEEEGRVMIATNNYPRGDYTPTEYGYVKRMNLEMQEWDIPTVNLLGALDDCSGNGHWADGYHFTDNDLYHPTEIGHTEFMHAIVPSLFDALAAGKPRPIRRASEGTTLNDRTSLVIVPEDQVHPFTLACRVKNIGEINVSLDLGEGSAPALPQNMPADMNWHTLAISHYYAAGKTYIYVDGVEQSVTDGKMLLNSITLSGRCKVADLHFWRSGMNAEEMAALENGRMLCSSLELYCPLDNGVLDNLAQSTNTVQLITKEEPTATEQIANAPYNRRTNAYTVLGQPVDPSFRGSVTIIDGKKVLH